MLSVRSAKRSDILYIDDCQHKAKGDLGFIPIDGIAKAIDFYQVLILQEDTERAGFLMVGRGKTELKIFQIFVRETQRRMSDATSLLAFAKARTHDDNLRAIDCKVAADIEANKFWTALGFIPMGFRINHGQKNRLMIQYRRPELCPELWIHGSVNFFNGLVSTLPGTSDLQPAGPITAANASSHLDRLRLLRPLSAKHYRELDSALPWETTRLSLEPTKTNGSESQSNSESETPPPDCSSL